MTKTTLVFKGTNISPKAGDVLTDFRGDTYIFVDSTPPYEPLYNLFRGGKVTVREPGRDSTQQFYPSVFSLEFILTPEA